MWFKIFIETISAHPEVSAGVGVFILFLGMLIDSIIVNILKAWMIRK
ncbi:MAG TPA: hypothetical protein VNX68_17675 [Nitrosopumilaceae archaeon]|jgi:hypothetical protein|nr:hypothetical protein [Nitrosopumilaceae archaeon]